MENIEDTAVDIEDIENMDVTEDIKFDMGNMEVDMKNRKADMDKNVIISVKGTQKDNDRDPANIELITEGKYSKDGDAYYITYQESQVTGMDGTTTTLKVDGGIVTLMRSGVVNSHFVFEQGQKHISHYDTLHGAFTIGVFTNEVDVNVNDCGGEIRVNYQLDIDNRKSGDNDFHMHIREAGFADDELSRKYQKGN